MIFELCLMLGFHLLDMLFTMLLIKKVSKTKTNAYELELNYHKHFFKKFGIVKGGY